MQPLSRGRRASASHARVGDGERNPWNRHDSVLGLSGSRCLEPLARKPGRVAREHPHRAASVVGQADQVVPPGVVLGASDDAPRLGQDTKVGARGSPGGKGNAGHPCSDSLVAIPALNR